MEAGRPKFKLQSIAQLEQELGKRQATLMRLIAEREREQLRLSTARQQLEKLEGHVHELDASITSKNRAVFVLVDEVDWLLRLQKRVHERARQLTQELKRESQADTPIRSHDRHPLAVEVTAHSDTHFYTGFSQNISEGGLFVATYQTRSEGSRFPVSFTFPGTETPLECMVEVAWVRAGKVDDVPEEEHLVPGMGLRFIGLTEEARTRINDFLDEREPLFFPEFDDLL